MKLGRSLLVTLLIMIVFIGLALGANIDSEKKLVDNEQSNEKEGDDINTKDNWLTYQEVERKLNRLSVKYGEKVSVRSIGKSHENRDIWSVRTGRGDKVLLIISEIHGNEKSGTEAILQLIKNIVASQEKSYKNVYENITVVAIPILNPDGSILQQRTNSLSWDEFVNENPELKKAKPPSYYREEENGFDINRDFNPNLNYEFDANDLPWTGSDPGLFITNEAKALRDLYLELKDE